MKEVRELDLNTLKAVNFGHRLDNYTLMLKDKPLLHIHSELDVEVLEKGRLPLELRCLTRYTAFDIEKWLSTGVLECSRENYKRIMNTLGLEQVDKVATALACKGLSLIDSYWITKEDSKDTWESVNLFNNTFSNAIGELAFTGKSDFTVCGEYRTPETTTKGCYAKCWRREEDGIYLYKGNTQNGFESENEYVCSLILDILDVPHVEYTLTEYLGRVSSRCKLLTDEDEAIVPFYDFDIFARRVGSTGLDIVRNNWKEQLSEMIVVDGILNNIDRHSYNWGLVMDNTTGNVLGLHPLFDHNCALEEREGMSHIYAHKGLVESARYVYKRMENRLDFSKLKNWLESRECRKIFSKLYGDTGRLDCIKERIKSIED